MMHYSVHSSLGSGSYKCENCDKIFSNSDKVIQISSNNISVLLHEKCVKKVAGKLLNKLGQVN